MSYKSKYYEEEVAPIQMEVVNCDLLNLRAEPSLTALIIGQLRKGDKITVKEKLDGWVETEKGYLKSEYLKEI